jgi:hypothetical protein
VFKRVCHENEKEAAYKTRSVMVLHPHIIVNWFEGRILKQKTTSKKQARAEKADLLDWLLAIDACLT